MVNLVLCLRTSSIDKKYVTVFLTNSSIIFFAKLKMGKSYERLDIVVKSADPAGDIAKSRKRKSKAAKVARKIGKAIAGEILQASRIYREQYLQSDVPVFYGMATVYA